jgi:hypothetical protein
VINKLYLLTVSLTKPRQAASPFLLEEYNIENGHNKLVSQKHVGIYYIHDWMRLVNERLDQGIGRLRIICSPFKFGIEYKVYASDYEAKDKGSYFGRWAREGVSSEQASSD